MCTIAPRCALFVFKTRQGALTCPLFIYFLALSLSFLFFPPQIYNALQSTTTGFLVTSTGEDQPTKIYQPFFRRGHFNPATTLACAMMKQIDWVTAAYYSAGQIFGSIIGSLMLWVSWFALVPVGSQLGATVTNEDTSVWQALTCELVLSFIFHTVLLAFYTVPNKYNPPAIEHKGDSSNQSDEEKNMDEQHPNTVGASKIGTELTTLEAFMSTHDTGMVSLYVTVVLVVCLVVGVTVSGGSLNPARSFGPAVVSGTWYNHWIYWVGPCGGAALAAVLVGSLKQP
jgi:glycerol uptake facilitator-like aquaporin